MNLPSRDPHDPGQPTKPPGDDAAPRHANSTARFVVLESEADRKAFDNLYEDLMRDLAPWAGLERILFDQVLIAAWNMRRCEARIAELAAEGQDPLRASNPSQQFKNIETYHRRNERNFQRALKQLREIQTERIYRQASESSTSSDVSIIVRTQNLRKACLNEDWIRTQIESSSVRTALKVPELPAHRYGRDNSTKLLRKL